MDYLTVSSELLVLQESDKKELQRQAVIRQLTINRQKADSILRAALSQLEANAARSSLSLRKITR